MASSLFILRAWQSSRTTSLQVLFNLPLGLGPSTSYSTHFFSQSSSFRSTCPYQCSLFCCNTNAMSSIPSLSLSTPHLISNPLGCFLLSQYHYINLISTGFQYPPWFVSFLLPTPTILGLYARNNNRNNKSFSVFISLLIILRQLVVDCKIFKTFISQ